MRRRRLGSLMMMLAGGAALAGLAGAKGASAQQPPRVPIPIPVIHPIIPVTLSGCARTAVPIDLAITPTSFPHPVPISVTAGSGVAISFDPIAPIAGPGATSVRTTMLVDYRPGAPDPLVTVSAAGGAQPARFSIHKVPMSVVAVTPQHVASPRFGRAGQTITISGTGLCTDATYRFSNGVAPTTLTQSASGAIQLTAPIDAGDGPITVDYADLHAATAPVAFTDVRSSAGFSWGNRAEFESALGGYDMGDMTADFGLGVAGNPVGYFVMGIADAAFTSGNCFGFSTLVGRSIIGTRGGSYPSWDGSNPSVTFSNPTPAADTWHIFGPVLGGGGDIVRQQLIARDIHRAHLMQLSTEFLSTFTAATNLSGDPATFRHQLEYQFAQNRPALVTIENSCDHVVLAYDLHDTGGGNFAVSVYDPNVPYVNDEETNVGTHVDRLHASSLSVMADHTFSYDDSASVHCSGSLSDVRAIPVTAIPQPGQGTMVGDVGGLAHVFGSASVTQVTDPKGRTLLRGNGAMNLDPATRIADGVAFSPFNGQPGNNGDRIFYFRTPAAYRYAVQGRGAGPYTATFVSPGVAATLENVPASPGAADDVTVDPAGGMDVRGASSKPFTARLSVRTPSGFRTVAVFGALGPGGASHLAFDAARNAIVYRHAGAKAPVHFEISDAHGKTTTAAVAVDAGDEITVQAPWSALATGAGSMVHRTPAGVVATHPLH